MRVCENHAKMIADDDTEIKIQNAIQFLTKNKTTVVIAHRLSTIKDADNIYVLNDGEVIESGNHDYLLNLKGMYSQMWNFQKVIKK